MTFDDFSVICDRFIAQISQDCYALKGSKDYFPLSNEATFNIRVRFKDNQVESDEATIVEGK